MQLIREAKMNSLKKYFNGLFRVCIVLLLSVLIMAAAAKAGTPGMSSLGVKVGNLAPEFTFQSTAGKWVSLSDFRGKKVFLFSWATWCSCKEQLPALEEFYKKYKSDKLEVIAVASDSQGLKWVKPYLDKAKATFVSLIDPNNELAVKYNFLATQNGFMIDENGVIRMSEIGYDIRKPEQSSKLIKLIKTDFGAITPAQHKSLDEKTKELEASIAENPKALSKRLELAEIYRQAGSLDKAESALRDAIAQKKTYAESHYRLGVILYQKGTIEEAVKEWEKAYRYDSTNYLYMRNVEAYRNPEKFYSEIMDKGK
jgi:peroxiredoxin